MDTLNHLRAGEVRKFEIPADVSEDFKKHFSAWALEQHPVPLTKEIKMLWKKASDKASDHLWKCATYLAVQCDMAELLVENPKPEAT